MHFIFKTFVHSPKHFLLPYFKFQPAENLFQRTLLLKQIALNDKTAFNKRKKNLMEIPFLSQISL